MGVVLLHPQGEFLPRSMVVTCWYPSPKRLRHRRHTCLQFFLTQPSTNFDFWMQNITGHIEMESIFVLLWRSKRPLLMCICPALQLRSLSVIAASCWVQTFSLIWIIICPLLKHSGQMIVPYVLCLTERNVGLFCETNRSESDCLC